LREAIELIFEDRKADILRGSLPFRLVDQLVATGTSSIMHRRLSNKVMHAERNQAELSGNAPCGPLAVFLRAGE
jgi:hypothetical protein